MRIKTIDINAKEWFDKVNGNSYFSAVITLNYGTKTAKEICLPFQYGYGEHYIDIAGQELNKQGFIHLVRHNNGAYTPLWHYCRDNHIILRTLKKDNCLKKDL